jgi:hypothetical protein
VARVRVLDRGRRAARRTYAYVLTYLVLVTTWVATASRCCRRGSSVDRSPDFEESSRVVGPLAFSTVAFAGYIVVAIGVGRAGAPSSTGS